ncbi:hypothetical protein H9P43_008913 [Blastocladiella emersonii ATCC 22665]|nr:hypothetical protein H9P43_008913 [Blastocladiella emersonii ATCC 22665]
MSLGRKRIDFEAVFTGFIRVVDQLFSCTPSDPGAVVGGMDLYESVYQMCNTRPKPMAEDLFLRLADYLARHTQEIAKRVHASDHALQTYAAEWEIYLFATQTLNIVCDVLNRSICTPLRGANMSVAMRAHQERRPLVRDSVYKRQSVESLAFVLWKDNVFRKLRKDLIGSVADVVRGDREGVLGPHEACKALALSLVTLQARVSQSMSLYLYDYESVFIAESRKYYETESRRYARDLSVSEFMRMADDRLKQEQSRAARYLHPSSVEKVLFECNAQYIDAHKDKICFSFKDMLVHTRREDLELAYSLLSQIPNGITLLTQVYEAFVGEEGRKLLSPDPRTLVASLGDLHATRTSEIQALFKNDPKFVASLDKAYRSVINDSDAVNSPKQIAQYVDWLMKKSSKQSDAEVERALVQVMVLFAYIDDKDVFQKVYARLLAKRLIQRLSTSDELEYTVLTRLKMACGVEYTSKLQRMFTDMTLSADTSAQFREFPDHAGPELHAMVLTAGTWPISQASAPVLPHLPAPIAASVAAFTAFYGTKHNGRKLFWMWHLCRADVRLNGFDKRYEVSVALHQYAVLALFNDAPRLTRAEIAGALGCPQHDADRTVQSLIDAGLLLAAADGSDGGAIAINDAFTSKRAKLRLTLSLADSVAGGASAGGGSNGALRSGRRGTGAGGDDEDDEATRAAVEEDRKLFLQATMVRIMKSQRTVDHNQLVTSVIDLATARFRPSIALIKKCIEILIDKQYIERATGGNDRYVYVA